MAKTDPAGLYRPGPVAGDVGLPELVRYVMLELELIGNALDFGRARAVDFLHVAPGKPFEGLTVGADGTDWNPGAGKGVYTYYSGAWNKLG